MKLYYFPGACSISPHIALREAGLQFDLERVDPNTRKTTGGEEYAQVNPKGYVPALRLDNGEVLTEGAVIVQYVADQKPEAGLAPPAGTMERWRLQEWLTFIATELHKGVSPLFNAKISDEMRESVKARVKSRVDFLARNLEGHEFLLGDKFTVVDGYAFYALRAWQRASKADLSAWPDLARYYARLGARPSVDAALKAEGISLDPLKA
ncbi:MAG TPA: glutathione transferase GstA [Gemmatimonadales bacterium]|nr:glutathione transferase GstA [Gemmatimonadales bacterium]